MIAIVTVLHITYTVRRIINAVRRTPACTLVQITLIHMHMESPMDTHICICNTFTHTHTCIYTR